MRAAAVVLMVFLLPLAINETGELAPWLAERLLRAGAKLLGSKEATERYTEDWLANLERVPGKITKLCWACALLLGSVPALSWQIRARARRVKRTRADGPSHVAPSQVIYQARPGRRVVIASDLADLRGPVTGMVELPLRLYWQPDRTFDLGDPDMLRWMYANLLREASRSEDLAAYLNGETLAEVWPDLFLPRGVRLAWEEQHPLLRATNP
jgi:hypothetical protein